MISNSPRLIIYALKNLFELSVEIYCKSPKILLKFGKSGQTRGALLHKRGPTQSGTWTADLQSCFQLTWEDLPYSPERPRGVIDQLRPTIAAQVEGGVGPWVGASCTKVLNSCIWPAGCPPTQPALPSLPAAGPVAPRMRSNRQGGFCACADCSYKTRRIYELTRSGQEENACHQLQDKDVYSIGPFTFPIPWNSDMAVGLGIEVYCSRRWGSI